MSEPRDCGQYIGAWQGKNTPFCFYYVSANITLLKGANGEFGIKTKWKRVNLLAQLLQCSATKKKRSCQKYRSLSTAKSLIKTLISGVDVKMLLYINHLDSYQVIDHKETTGLLELL